MKPLTSLALAGAVAATLSASACTTSPTSPSASGVEYRIVGTTTAVGVTFRNSTGGTTSNDAEVPWSYTWSEVRSGDLLFLSVRNLRDGGTLKAQIFKNGQLYRESETNRGFGSVTVTGTY
jgi:hypothetical protein